MVALKTSVVKLALVEFIFVVKLFSAVVALAISAVKLAVFAASAVVALKTSAVILAVLAASTVVALVTSAVKLALVEFILVVNPVSAMVALLASALILLDKETVSLAIRLDNIAAVSEIFNFVAVLLNAVCDKLFICLLTNKVLAMVLSATVESCVTVVGRPSKVGEVNILFDKVSLPANVAKVPEVGKIILLAAVVVMVKSPTPLVIILLAIEIVFPLLLIPVPPF